MKQVIQELEQIPSWKELMRLSCKNNKLKTALANQLTLLKVKSMNTKLNKSYQTIGERVGTIWIQNQLKTFHWISIAISGLRNITIDEFSEHEWGLLESIFLHKKRSFLKFQAHRLIFSKNKNNKWTAEEGQLLKKVVEESGDKNHQWNEIARTMFQVSEDRVFRTGKHCRQRWLNYLDPSKQRGQWSLQQDLFLLTRVQQSGKKWSEYAAHLNRTEHMVKNRFNSLIIKQKKLTPNLKKEEKILVEIKRKLESSQFQSKQISQPIAEQSQVIVNELIEVEQQHPQIEEEQKIDNLVGLEDLRQIVMDEGRGKPVVHEEDQPQPVDILQYARDQEQMINLPTMNQFGIYSPYWNYSPSNGTPNNFMNSSPSPLSFYINSNFASYFSRFTAQLHNLSTPQHEDNQ